MQLKFMKTSEAGMTAIFREGNSNFRENGEALWLSHSTQKGSHSICNLRERASEIYIDFIC